MMLPPTHPLPRLQSQLKQQSLGNAAGINSALWASLSFPSRQSRVRAVLGSERGQHRRQHQPGSLSDRGARPDFPQSLKPASHCLSLETTAPLRQRASRQYSWSICLAQPGWWQTLLEPKHFFFSSALPSSHLPFPPRSSNLTLKITIIVAMLKIAVPDFH